MSRVITLTSGVPLQLLVAEDSEDDFELLLRNLRAGNYIVTAVRVHSQKQLDAELDRPWDLVISDWLMPGFSGRAVLETVRARSLDLPVIVSSGTPGEEAAVQALHLGALDFLSKDRPRRLVPAVQRALREAEGRRARVRIERELKLSEERYRTGFAVTPEPLLTYDLAQRRIIDANDAAQRMYRRTLEELRELPFLSLSAPVQSDGRPAAEYAADNLARAMTGERVTIPWLMLVEGEIIPTEISMIQLPTQAGNLARVQIVDLRERMKMEAMRRRSADLELQNRRIQEANRLKSEFLANMSHELRTPLNAIIGFAELLHDGQVDAASPQHKEFLGDILTSGRHLLQLVNDVLDLAKVEAGKLEFRPEPIDIRKSLVEVAAILRTTAAGKRIRLEIEVDPALAEDKRGIVLDPSRFKQVAYNYLSNALKFTANGGRVIARIGPEGDSNLRFEVEDNGIGISANDVGRLFSEFQQLDAGAAKRHQGTGLGLALTRRIVEAQGGSVGVNSAVGTGSTFHAILPRRTRAMVTPLVPRTTTRDGAQTVLVVEDDARDQAQLVTTLSGAGFSVELATTGAEALARWRERRFDALTIDLLLPDMSGLDLLAALAGEDRRPTIPIIVVTVVPDANVVAGFPVHDVLHKPVNRDSLLASLQRAGVSGTLVEGS
ncbi:MAG: response regulator [Deltaproteobacteria bacterium]|nr:response regulator [Deltaproteobacteria bacterium]